MTLKLVTGPAFSVTCLNCKKGFMAGSPGIDRFGRETTSKIYADLDGEPFKAYYCEPCSNIIACAIGMTHIKPDEA
jgi:hypothetical protein